MDATLVLSAESRTTAGVLLLALVTVEWGGLYILQVVRGRAPLTEFQRAFARAGHAHAGVLVTLGLVCQILADAAGVTGLQAAVARGGVPLAAILLPAGFFFWSAGKAATAPPARGAALWGCCGARCGSGCPWGRPAHGVERWSDH